MENNTRFTEQEIEQVSNELDRLMIHLDATKETWSNSVMIIDDIASMTRKRSRSLIYYVMATKFDKSEKYTDNLIKLIESMSFFFQN